MRQLLGRTASVRQCGTVDTATVQQLVERNSEDNGCVFL